MRVIGYIPNKNKHPFIPESIVIQDDNAIKKLQKDGSCQIYSGDYSSVEPFFLPEESWFAVEETGFEQFNLVDERAWRSKRSQELVKLASTIQGDPMRILEIGMTAATLQGFSLPELSKKIDEVRSDGESIEEALNKIKFA